MRTIIDLPDDQIAALDHYRREIGIFRAEAIRRAVASFLPAGPKTPGHLRDHPVFGSSKGTPGNDASRLVEELRSEWE